ncbi:MAG: MotA/TolQ/ExbB proton channel family protein [Mangrovibacterium sp.]
MKKLFALLAVFGMLYVAQPTALFAQEVATEQTEAVQQNAETREVATAATEEAAAAEVENGKGLHSALKQKFIEGGVGFMAFVLVCLILGLALSLERVIYLNLATTNNKKLLLQVEEALAQGGIEAAKEVCRNTRGPVASIFYQGLDRSDEGMEVVEKTVVAYGGVQTGLLEKGLSWMALFIALAPMLGFMGTVIGMIAAFDAIEVAGDISPTLVAGGIKVALITTVAGLIVAMILQIFYNYCLAKIDSIVNSMEDASISLIDILVKHNLKK